MNNNEEAILALSIFSASLIFLRQMLKYTMDYYLERDTSSGFAMFVYIAFGIVNAAILVLLTVIAMLFFYEITK